MLLNVNVRNLALIKEADIYFKDGMNILTGETGAGKSIIIGSINIALGSKVPKEMIRDENEPALVELVFQIENKEILDKLVQKDIVTDNGQIVITRKIINGRSITKVNGETFSVNNLKSVTSLLIDIHGQHDHQSLLHTEKHIEILDDFAKNNISDIKGKVKKAFEEYRNSKAEVDSFDMDEEQRIRECEFLEFEINEISDLQLQPGEDEELEEKFKKISNMKKILEVLSTVHNCMISNEASGGVSDMLGMAVQEMGQISDIDKELNSIYDEIANLDNLCNDIARDISEYAENCVFDEEECKYIEERLSLINHLKLKFGNDIEQILSYCNEKKEKLDKLQNYKQEKEKAIEQMKVREARLEKLSDELTAVRKKEAADFEKKVGLTLKELNFPDVDFKVDFSKTDNYSATGNDYAEFMISTNPGEPIRPLAKIASGGELSRIMLGIKTIMAGEDNIETLIFDEIDTGISGRTAQKVAEQMNILSRRHQIICITHLPQIASMADAHFKIEKTVNSNETSTNILELNNDESVNELARMLSGAEITENVINNAREMKKLALKSK